MSKADVDAKLRRYSERPSFDCVQVQPAEAFSTPDIGARSMSTGEAHYHLGELLLALDGATPQGFENLERGAMSRRHASPCASAAHVDGERGRCVGLGLEIRVLVTQLGFVLLPPGAGVVLGPGSKRLARREPFA